MKRLQRKQDLADLVRGGRPQVPKADAAVADWSQVADRPPLMQRHEHRPPGATHQVARRRRHLPPQSQATSQHEAQLVAMIAEVIGREGFEFWDDEEYRQLRPRSSAGGHRRRRCRRRRQLRTSEPGHRPGDQSLCQLS